MTGSYFVAIQQGSVEDAECCDVISRFRSIVMASLSAGKSYEGISMTAKIRKSCKKLAHISFKLNISVVRVATLFKSWFDFNPYLSPFCTHCINPAVLCSCFQALTGLAILCDRQRTEPDSSSSTALTTKKVPLHLSGSSIWVYPVCASINSICPLMSQLIFTSEHFESLWEMQDGKGMYSRKKTCDGLEITFKFPR